MVKTHSFKIHLELKSTHSVVFLSPESSLTSFSPRFRPFFFLFFRLKFVIRLFKSSYRPLLVVISSSFSSEMRLLSVAAAVIVLIVTSSMLRRMRPRPREISSLAKVTQFQPVLAGLRFVVRLILKCHSIDEGATV